MIDDTLNFDDEIDIADDAGVKQLLQLRKVIHTRSELIQRGRYGNYANYNMRHSRLRMTEISVDIVAGNGWPIDITQEVSEIMEYIVSQHLKVGVRLRMRFTGRRASETRLGRLETLWKNKR